MVSIIILSGGFGKRLWPLSTKEKPKQCLKLFSKNTLIEDTINRLKKIVPEKNIYISTNSEIAKKTKQILPKVNYVIEPLRKNTAAAIGLSLIHIMKKNKDETIIVETSDHTYKNDTKYLNYLKQAVEEAEKNNIILMGIKPNRVETEYGYIKKGTKINKDFYEVEKFVEKPTKGIAELYVKSKKYLWNSGIFIFKAQTMLKAIKKHTPKLYKSLMKIKKSQLSKTIIQKEFEKIESISIDYAIMEKEKKLEVLEAKLYWDDIGSYQAIERQLKSNKDNNTIKGKHVGLNSKNNIIIGKKLIATIGIEDLIIIETENTIFVAKKDQTKKIKELKRKIDKK